MLTDAQAARLDKLPNAKGGPVGNVLVALEAKACMTKFTSSRPRLYDELNSSHLTIHGASAQAAAAALVMINVSPEFISPNRNKVNLEGRQPDIMWFKQPQGAASIVEKIAEIPRRSGPPQEGGSTASASSWCTAGTTVVTSPSFAILPLQLLPTTSTTTR